MLLQGLVLIITFAGSLAFDFCHTDPRLRMIEDDPSSTSCPAAIYIPELDRNPNHALHDRVWALSHYLKHCVDTESTLVLNEHVFYNLSLCKEEGASLNPKRPTWGICVAFILSRWHNILLNFSQSRVWPDEMPMMPDSCFSRHIWIGVQPPQSVSKDSGVNVSHFRKLSWFGRNCEQQQPCLGGLGPLPEYLQQAALSNIVSAVYDFLDIEFTPHETVNILVYDRNDTFRRRWNGAKDVFSKLELQKSLNVRIVHRMPESFSQQVKLFTWADILVAPHGGAMANTIFMRSGSDILEVRRNCEADTRFANFMPWDWTGWHAHLLGLNLMYIGCTMQKQKNGGSLEHAALSQFTVNESEVLRVVEGCIQRQIHRKNASRQTRWLREKFLDEESEELFNSVLKEFRNITFVEFLSLFSITTAILIGSKLSSRRFRRVRSR
eukprot:TRINITY_DN14141_c0_g1_i1.p1 TRINITY_DN14141_c0_g1~~TRINITY_DN14141_c0_g1_i1.p1  ORF type:complete len:438 (-),score=38.61 TRINITY_DN14141_c0_g1_i1:1654-2967(-)